MIERLPDRPHVIGADNDLGRQEQIDVLGGAGGGPEFAGDQCPFGVDVLKVPLTEVQTESAADQERAWQVPQLVL
jgi:hypothetical protein